MIQVYGMTASPDLETHIPTAMTEWGGAGWSNVDGSIVNSPLTYDGPAAAAVAAYEA